MRHSFFLIASPGRKSFSKITFTIAPRLCASRTTERMSFSTYAQSPRQRLADVDHHVDLGRAVATGELGLVALALGRAAAVREADDGADGDAGAFEQLRGGLHRVRLDAHRRDLVFLRQPASRRQFPIGHRRVQQRVVDHLRELVVGVPHARVVFLGHRGTESTEPDGSAARSPWSGRRVEVRAVDGTRLAPAAKRPVSAGQSPAETRVLGFLVGLLSPWGFAPRTRLRRVASRVPSLRRLCALCVSVADRCQSQPGATPSSVAPPSATAAMCGWRGSLRTGALPRRRLRPWQTAAPTCCRRCASRSRGTAS